MKPRIGYCGGSQVILFALVLVITMAMVDNCFSLEPRKVKIQKSDLDLLKSENSQSISACHLYYYYLIDSCAYVTVLGLDENQTVGVHFNMADHVPWLTPCDTSVCLILDELDIVLYDVLPAPNSQLLNIKVYEADQDGKPIGDPLANRDFEPEYTGSQRFVKCKIDFTNNHSQSGIDLSGCRGNFIALLTWRNSTNHPMLVLDNISECVDSCQTNPSCCQMGAYPFVYPRSTVHTHLYAGDGQWQRLDGICDEAGCNPYGYLEAFWESYFCIFSPSTQPDTWGSLKAIYR